MMRMLLAFAIFGATATPVYASCRIHNDTGLDFKVESGNTSNQSVGPHTTTSIASGTIKGVDAKAGKSISGSCKDGDEMEVTDDHGTPVLAKKK
ncbi:MAG: hypothetical protein QM831_25625 [Kofleriaceae bacterium]